MNGKLGLTGVSLLFVLATLAACGGGGSGDGSVAAPNGGGSSASAKAWGTAVLIGADNAGPADYPQIAIGANGDAMAVWQQWDGTRSNIWSNRYTAGTGWGTAALIETDGGGPHIAMDANGNALAVWSRDVVAHAIWANRFQ